MEGEEMKERAKAYIMARYEDTEDGAYNRIRKGAMALGFTIEEMCIAIVLYANSTVKGE